MTNVIISNAILTITGLFFLYTGIMSIARPKAFANVLGLEPIGRSGEIEIRAQYGGFFTAAAIPQFLAIGGLLPYNMAFLISLVIFGGLIAGRLLALIFRSENSTITPMTKALFWIDAIGALAALAGLWITQ